MPLLHGILLVTVHEAKDLSVTRRIQTVGCLKRYVCCGMLPELTGSCDPYLCLDVGNARRLRTRFIVGTRNPEWHERHEVYVADEAEELTIQVKDADVVGSDFLGQAIIPVSEVIHGQVFDKWVMLTDTSGKQLHCKDATRDRDPSRVHITIHYKPVGQEDTSGLRPGEVPRTYFPLRPGNKVTLYHDAACQPGPVKAVQLAGGNLYSESSCWDDLYVAIQQAESLIWIAGWSVWTETVLQRTPASPSSSPTLGELLKRKAEQGVNVLLLVWDDASNNTGLIEGVMATHDQETYSYFKGTEVTCVLAPRQGGTEDSYLQKAARATTFTHHQKTVIVDSPIPPGSAPRTSATGIKPTKRLLSFVGGLDLTNGRYDFPSHPLFDTCNEGGPHSLDKHQACMDISDSNKPCPREPWHDIHARIEGPAAVDVAVNFMERWVKQAGRLKVHKLFDVPNHQTLLLPRALTEFKSKRAQVKGQLHRHIELRIATIKAHDPAMELPDIQEGEDWNVQVFRSIDSDSAQGIPQSAEGSYEAGLAVGKGKSIDASIHRAYINLIRRSKRYLYLENQYFLGSAHLWDSDTDTPCYNQVPAEIVLKIESKIKAGEPYRVYIVLPMFSEGIASSGSVQAVLYFQTKTRQMMYKRIARAIAEAGLQGQVHPTDYLQFFCLGKREGYGQPSTVPNLPENNIAVNGDASHLEQQNNARGRAPASSVTGKQPEAAREPMAETPAMGDVDGSNNGAAAGHPDTFNLNTAQGRAAAARRFMIYVHSKMMVVDDEYIILGSANINQRSLDGTRDSEICIGAFQSGHTMRNKTDRLPRGQVAGFRKALWLEHLGELPPETDDPSSLQCIRLLSHMATDNWAAYVHPDTQPLPHGHLLMYPNWVDADGSVGPLPDCDEFPDVKGKIMGTKSLVLPNILTT